MGIAGHCPRRGCICSAMGSRDTVWGKLTRGEPVTAVNRKIAVMVAHARLSRSNPVLVPFTIFMDK